MVSSVRHRPPELSCLTLPATHEDTPCRRVDLLHALFHDARALHPHPPFVREVMGLKGDRASHLMCNNPCAAVITLRRQAR
jgi:hypothetical protein